MSSPRVGFIGLGSQGGPMARRIAESGMPTALWARRPETLEPFADTAATIAPTPAALGAASDVVCLCVVNDDDVEDVLLREDGVAAGLEAGGIVVIHATVKPTTCQRLSQELAARGIRVIDAPVSGGGHAAAAGELLVMVGGDPEAVEVCQPIFETYGSPIIRLGPIGSGEAAKALNNLVFTAHLGIAIDAFELAASVGVDKEAMAKVLEAGSGGSRAAGYVAMAAFDATVLAGFASILRKDVDIALGLGAGDADAPPALLLRSAASGALAQLGEPDPRPSPASGS